MNIPHGDTFVWRGVRRPNRPLPPRWTPPERDTRLYTINVAGDVHERLAALARRSGLTIRSTAAFILRSIPCGGLR